VASVSLADETATQSTTTPVTKLEFTKTVTIPLGGYVPNETFTFEMVPKEADTGATIKDGQYNLFTGVSLGESKSTTTLTFTNWDGVDKEDTVEQLQKTSQTGSFDLSGLSFPEIGVYQYTVKEQLPATGDKDYLIYSKTEYTVYLYVGNDGNKNVILNAVSTDSTGTNKVPIEFTNNVKTGSLVVKKIVSGSMAEKDREFNFTIKIDADATLDKDAGLLAVKTNGNAVIENFYLLYDENKGGYVPEKQLTLSDGEYVRIDGLFRGMSYEVVETTPSDYTCRIKSTKDGEDTSIAGSTVIGTIGTGDRSNLEEFTNTRNLTTDTGIILDVAPYILLALLTAAGLIVFAVRRRKMGR
jgi:pilin isopeptide linkage protein